MLWTALLAAATYFESTGREDAACMVLGYIEAHEPGALLFARVTRLAQLPELTEDAATRRLKKSGAALDRHTIVRFVLDQLPTGAAD